MKNEYRKITISPIYIYNIFLNTYYRYFENRYNRQTKKIEESLESFLKWFISTYYYKFKEDKEEFENYLFWIFQTYGKISIRQIHKYIELWEKSKSLEEEPFSLKISKYLRDNYITWNNYIKPKKGYFPIILQHYISDRNFPFELLLYLNILDKVENKNKNILKMLISKELYDIKKYKIKAEANEKFIQNEIENIKNSI